MSSCYGWRETAGRPTTRHWFRGRTSPRLRPRTTRGSHAPARAPSHARAHDEMRRTTVMILNEDTICGDLTGERPQVHWITREVSAQLVDTRLASARHTLPRRGTARSRQASLRWEVASVSSCTNGPAFGGGSGLGERLDDHVGDCLRHFVGEKEDLSRNRHDTNVRTLLERCPFVCGKRAVALLGMHDPRGHRRLAEPPRAVVVAMEPTQIRLQSSAHVAGVVPREVGLQFRLTFWRDRRALQDGPDAFLQDGRGQRPQDRTQSDYRSEEAWLIGGRQADPQQHDRTGKSARDHHLVCHDRTHTEADDHVDPLGLGQLSGATRIGFVAEVAGRRSAHMSRHGDGDHPGSCEDRLGHHFGVRPCAAHPAWEQQDGLLGANRTGLDHLPFEVHDDQTSAVHSGSLCLDSGSPKRALASVDLPEESRPAWPHGRARSRSSGLEGADHRDLVRRRLRRGASVVSTWSILGASYRDRTGAQGDALTPWRGYRARWRLAECLVEGGLDEADVGDPWRARGVHGSVRAPIWWRRRRGRNQSRHHHGYHL